MRGTSRTRSGSSRLSDKPPLIIVNPAAGGGRGVRFWNRVAAACAAAGVTVEVVQTARAGDATEAAASAGDRLVVAVGGDGTAHEVVNGLLRRAGGGRPRFGALMCGTGGDLARTVPSPKDPASVPGWLRQARWRTIDAARVDTAAGRRYFINAADVGIGAEVARRAARGPAVLGGTVNFLGAAVFSLLGHRNTRVRLRLDDGPMEEVRVRTVAVTNGAYFGAGMRIAPAARPDDGWLDVVIIGDIGRFKGIWSLPLLYQGRHGQLEQVRFARARRVEIDSDSPIGVQADGERVGMTPVVFQVAPAALDVLGWA